MIADRKTRTTRRIVFLCGLALLAAGLWAGCSSPFPSPQEALSRQELVALSDSLSEGAGYFDSDNLITNETSYQHVLEKLQELPVQGGVYLGVGPGQNFTYMAAIKPEMAIILDIRRDNLLQHLWYKAIFETSPTRSDYISRLLGRPPPPEFEETPETGVAELVAAFRQTPSSEEYFLDVRRQLKERIEAFGFRLDASDWDFLGRVERTFFSENLDLQFTSHRRRWQRRYPTLEEILLERDLAGRHRHYLNDDAGYQFVRRLQLQNRVIPVTGDLAGPEALKAIGNYLRDSGKKVTAFYVSNVEFYLFRHRAFSLFMKNVATLPIGRHSVFIRSYFNYGHPHPEQVRGHSVSSSLERIANLLQDYQHDQIHSYWDVAATHYIPLFERTPSRP